MDENEIVGLLKKRFGGRNHSVIQGIGDDAAVVRMRGARECWVITTDMLLENVDFRSRWLTPAQLGHKALAANLSDLAAMGATPRFFTVALALPAGVTKKWIADIYQGMSRLARRFEAILIGGDLSESPAGVQVTITAIGETSGRRPVYRSGGQPGDVLYVTGMLGIAAAGLRLLLLQRLEGKSNAERKALNAQRMPKPRCRVGAWLNGNGLVRCMMDLSDGLSTDLPRLCAASRVGAEISGDRLPVFPQSRSWQCDPLDLALNGGEDFELLFAVPPRRVKALESNYPAGFPRLSRIGELRRGRRVLWSARSGERLRPLTPAGFDHFRR